jgi:hypothetical protein
MTFISTTYIRRYCLLIILLLASFSFTAAQEYEECMYDGHNMTDFAMQNIKESPTFVEKFTREYIVLGMFQLGCTHCAEYVTNFLNKDEDFQKRTNNFASCTFV